jgi:hypothetical protein
MWYLFNQGSESSLFREPAEATLWNMGAANAFGGDVPDSAMLPIALRSSQHKLATIGPGFTLDSNVNALMLSMGLTSNSYYNGEDGLGFVSPDVMGTLLRGPMYTSPSGGGGAPESPYNNPFGAVPNFSDNYLSVLMTSGVLGLGTNRDDFSPFMAGQFNSDLGNDVVSEPTYQSFMGQMALSQNLFGTGVYPGGFPSEYNSGSFPIPNYSGFQSLLNPV